MEEFIYVGKIVNTHGIRGEIRILSNFDKKEKVFIPNMTLYLGRKKESVTITSYRHHKNFEMVCLEGYNDINQVLRLKGLYVYVLRKDLNLQEKELLEADYIGMEAWNEKECFGVIQDIEDRGRGNKIFVIQKDKKRILIPFHDVFIKKASSLEKRVYFKEIEGLIL